MVRKTYVCALRGVHVGRRVCRGCVYGERTMNNWAKGKSFLGRVFAFAATSMLCATVVAEPLIPPKAPGEEMDIEEFRQALIAFTGVAGATAQTSSILPYQIANLSAEEMQAVYDVFPNPRTFSALVEQLVSRSTGDEAGASDGGDGTGDPVSGIIGVPPPCESFEPDYPSSTLLDILTDIGLASVEPDERCTDDDVGTFVTAKIAATIAGSIAHYACESIVVVLGEGSNAPFCVAAGIADGVKNAAQFVLDACQELTDQVDSAEIEGVYENSKIIIDALCCVSVDQQRKIQGCNGQDDDCDGTIDECDEDTFGPSVFVDPSIQGACFDSAAEAEEALAAATNANDDCGDIEPIDIELSGTECDVDATISVSDDCGNETELPTAASFRIDGEAPTVTCSVTIDTLFPPNLMYTDVGFSYTAEDNCDGPLEIDVKVTSDEQTTLPPGNGKASPFPDAAILKKIDGTIDGVLLRNERGMLSDGRVYTIHVFATDQCGNVGSAACTVVVQSADDKPAVDNGQYFDATGIN